MKKTATNPARTIESTVSINLTPLRNNETLVDSTEALRLNGRDVILVFIWTSILRNGLHPLTFEEDLVNIFDRIFVMFLLRNFCP